MRWLKQLFLQSSDRHSQSSHETAAAATVRGLLLSAQERNVPMFQSFTSPRGVIEGIDPSGNVIDPRTLEISDFSTYFDDWTLLDLGYEYLGMWLLSWKKGDDYRLMEFTVDGTQVASLNVRIGVPWPWIFPETANKIRFPDFVLRN